MSWRKRINRSNFLYRLRHWEYWPMEIFLIPVIGMWIYFMIRARALAFFSAANPVINTGGMFGESKINILRRVPRELVPKTLFMAREEHSWIRLQEWMQAENLSFPLIGKPDIGERGFLVHKLKDEREARQYLKEARGDILIQEFIDLPLELSVLYFRFPDERRGHVSSVTLKEPLTVTGDGRSSIAELVADYPRARLQWKRLRKRWEQRSDEIPAAGEVVELDPIGNHCRGSTFRNGNHLIDERMVAVFNRVGQQMEGIHLGRFDLKCESIEALKQGRDFKVLEFNGVAGEPAHVYDPENSLWQAYRDYYVHCRNVYLVSQAVRAQGVGVMSVPEILNAFREYRRKMRRMRAQ